MDREIILIVWVGGAEIDVWMLLTKRGDCLSGQRAGADHFDPYGSAFLFFRIAQFAGEVIQGGEDGLEPLLQQPSRRIQADVAALLVKQGDAQLPLKLSDGLSQRRLCDLKDLNLLSQ